MLGTQRFAEGQVPRQILSGVDERVKRALWLVSPKAAASGTDTT